MSQESTLVEGLTIQPVPESQRTGKVQHLFSFWFTVQIIPLAVVTGLLGPTIFGLDVGSTVLAIVVGSVVGAVFMALHSAQGSKLGVPQMIQARAQFGMYGSVPITVIVVLIYVGWIVSLMVLAQQTLSAVWTGLGATPGLLLSTALTLTAVVVGYQLILRFNRIMVWLSGLALVLTLVYTGIEAADGGTGLTASGGSFTWAGFLGMASVVGVWQLSYAPYVSDYSRYLPSSTSTRAAFWYTYAGTVLGVIGAMTVGAFLVAGLGADGVLADLDNIMPRAVFVFVMLAFFLGAIDAGVINMYGSALCVLTCIQTFRLGWAPRASARHATAVVLAIAVFVASTTVSDDFMADYTNFILVLAYLLVPWSIINLVDYYLVHRGHYDPESFSDPNSGYGAFNVPALLSYVLGCLVQIPFMSTTLYVGAIAKQTGAVDTSWVVGSIATAFIYLALLRVLRRQPAPALTPETEVSA
ncbi:NCS1 family transporter [Nocardioides albidus]|uniref:NCS1 family transporter n=1 Tax=Nocardioides albidus TaxID=1517589 RepID=A0A5C4WJZ9_9ACTN|nr:cytosine permease [Nocardioides albidus]TNM48292.1 NCS1 family transporter [Nocardioides albidus]